MNIKFQSKQKGYTLLLAILIVSIILAISFGAFSLALRSATHSTYLRDSQRAFQAADRGVECALYWDNYYRGNIIDGTMFSTNPSFVQPAGAGSANCAGNNLLSQTGWVVISAAQSATTTFSLTYSDNTCSDVTVGKDLSSMMVNISSYGYSDCSTANLRRERRVSSVTYPISPMFSTNCPFSPQNGRYIIDYTKSEMYDGLVGPISITVVNYNTLTYGTTGIRSDGHDTGWASPVSNGYLQAVEYAYPGAAGHPILPGTYKVSAYAYDSYIGRELVSEPYEQFYVFIDDSSYNVIGRSFSPTGDLGDNIRSASWTGVVDSAMVVPASPVIDIVKVYHYYRENFGYNVSSSDSNGIVPVCVAFDR